MNHEDINNTDAGEIFLIDKELDWTSFDVVKKIRGIVKNRKVGHAGTLDPKATGLLIVCTGKKTKEINSYIGLDKEYSGTLQLGIKTPSYDLETSVIEQHDTSSITEQMIQETALRLMGKQTQLPPMYSALKYGGTPLYKYARKGISVERIEREIEITKFDISKIEIPFVSFNIACSKGAYIRSLVNDFGNIIGCGATLISLRRTRIGNFSIDNALTIAQLIEKRNQ